MSLYGTRGRRRERSGGDRQPVRPQQGLRLEAHPYRRSLRQPHRIRVRTRFRREKGRITGTSLSEADPLCGLRRCGTASSWCRSGSSTNDRPDPFSEYRAGFEIRTRRRCTRIGSAPCRQERLVRTYDFIYLDQRGTARPPAHQRRLAAPQSRSPVTTAARPKSCRRWSSATRVSSPKSATSSRSGADLARPLARQSGPRTGRSLRQRPAGHPGNEWHGALLAQPGRRPLRPAAPDARRPGGLALADPGVQLIDANGDGRTDLLVTTDGTVGLFPAALRRPVGPRSFQRYRHAPSFNLEDPEVKLVDLDGDGVTDAIRSGTRLECFFNDPKEGWNRHPLGRAPGTRGLPQRQLLRPARQVGRHDGRRPAGHRAGPRRQRRVLAQPRATATGASAFTCRTAPASPTATTPSASWSATWMAMAWPTSSMSTTPRSRSGSTRAATAGAIRSSFRARRRSPTWMLCVSWICSAAGSAACCGARTPTDCPREHLFFLDFTGGVKPYLLNEMDNHIGAVTQVEYAPSTRFYLEDQKRPGDALEDAAAVSGPGRRPRRGHRRAFQGQAHHRIPLPPRLLGRRRARVSRLRHGRAARHRVVRKVRRSGLHGADAFFARWTDKYFSPPTLTKTWFHQGPVGDEFGDWQEAGLVGRILAGRPAAPRAYRSRQSIPEHLAIHARWPARQTRRPAHPARQHPAHRTVCPRRLGPRRSALYGDANQAMAWWRNRAAGCRTTATAPHIFFPHAVAQRTTQWERGDDPMTQFTFHRRLRRHMVSRARRPASPAREAAISGGRCRRTVSRHARGTTYAKPDDTKRYIVNRVARTTSYEILNDGSEALLALKGTH